MNEKIKNSIENYEKALKKLHEFLSEPIVNDRDRAGIIKAFEFTFELSWETIQKICQEEQLEAGGPRSIIKHGFSLNIIENENEAIWLQMLEDRNLMSHTYREQVSKMVAERIEKDHIRAFDQLLINLKKR